MSSTTDSGDGPEVPAAVLDGLEIYDAERPFFDPDRSAAPRRSDGDRRVYLVAKLEVEVLTPDASGGRRMLGLYSTDDGLASIHFVGDDEATVDGLLAHSLVEPADELRQLSPAGQALLADHVAALGGSQ